MTTAKETESHPGGDGGLREALEDLLDTVAGVGGGATNGCVYKDCSWCRLADAVGRAKAALDRTPSVPVETGDGDGVAALLRCEQEDEAGRCHRLASVRSHGMVVCGECYDVHRGVGIPGAIPCPRCPDLARTPSRPVEGVPAETPEGVGGGPFALTEAKLHTAMLLLESVAALDADDPLDDVAKARDIIRPTWKALHEAPAAAPSPAPSPGGMARELAEALRVALWWMERDNQDTTRERSLLRRFDALQGALQGKGG